MRILHLDGGREMRGGQWQVLGLIEGLRGKGAECTLLARPGGPLFRAAAERGWTVRALSLPRVAVDARRHDLVHAHDSRSHTLAAVAGGAPLIVARRVAFPTQSPWKYGRAVRYIAVSRFVAGVLAAGGVPADRIDVVYDGVPLLAGATHRRGMIAPANAADPRKGAALVIEAARLAGVEVAFSTALDLDLPSAEVLIYLTYSEGLGSGVLLGMSAGAAVVASRVGGVPEIVAHGETGLLVENHPEAVAAALRQLAAEPELVRRLGGRARQTIEEKFTVQQMVRRTMDIYRQVLE